MKQYFEGHKNYYLTTTCVDMGYPDPGHDEWVLVRSEKRKYQFIQKIFGDRETKLIYYGEQKPNLDHVKKDIERNAKERKELDRSNKLKEIGI